MDEIRIENLKIFANHGVLQSEKKEGQFFYINAVIEIPLGKAGRTDALNDTVSYAELCEVMVKEMQAKSYDLIEAAAMHLIVHILSEYKMIKRITLELRKPDAPIDASFDSVSVRISRARHKVYIAYGSSMSYEKNGKVVESPEIIEGALKMLSDDPEIEIVKKSEDIVTEPYGGVAKNKFYNGIICAETFYEPEELLDCLHSVEKSYGRTRDVHWGDRTLDLDIVYYDNEVIETDRLSIPHADMQNRDFVLEPLNELAPDMVHPVLHMTTSQLLKLMKKCK
ncbi:MAG: 2-amino-4-hydroxy-6-hydroxymethyldihydropteridine diphosphokinase [Lachnospiraceae bacterium]|nr:2-amino-4-hydroxy-6-hydroxymethyldihydropteridine diphosphokinase [Lachnospiraceae bacterium]